MNAPSLACSTVDPGPVPAGGANPARGDARSLRPAVLIPAHDEADVIGDVMRTVREYCDYPVIVIDDCSTDGTGEVANAHGAVVLPLAVQLGAWGATQTGVRYALRQGYNLAITLDADGQHEPVYLAQLMEPVLAGYAQVSIGSCVERGSTLRRIGWRMIRFVSGIQLEDLTSGFRVYDQSAMRVLASWRASFLEYQDVGVLALLMSTQSKIASVPVVMGRRRNGRSRIFRSWRSIIYYMCHTLLLGLTKSRVYRFRASAETNG